MASSENKGESSSPSHSVQMNQEAEDPQEKTIESKERILNFGRQIHRAIEFFGEHPFVTGLLAILSVVGLIFSVIDFQRERKANEENTALLQSIKEEVDKPSRSDRQEALDISGRWNSEKAWKIISTKLTSASRDNRWLFCMMGDCRPEHAQVDEFNLLYRDRETVLFVTESRDPTWSCPPCFAIISFFEFEKKSGGWKLVQTDFAALRWGRWGGFNESNFSVKVIGHNIYGIFLAESVGAGGLIRIQTAVFAKVADNYRQVLLINTHEADSSAVDPEEKSWLAPDYHPEGTDWTAEFNIRQGSTGFFDLIVTAQGVRGNEPLNETTVFEFDGIQYVSPSVPWHLLRR